MKLLQKALVFMALVPATAVGVGLGAGALTPHEASGAQTTDVGKGFHASDVFDDHTQARFSPFPPYFSHPGR